MTRYDKRVQALAVGLAALAGYVDALAFVHLGGFFVSFMSGNSTRMGVGLAQTSRNAQIAGGLIGLFVAGVISGSLVGRVTGRHRRAAVLAWVAFALVVGATASALGFSRVAIAVMAIAMGAENAVFEQDGESRIGLTYMTGNLVKTGFRLTDALLGGPRFAWGPYMLLWVGLVAGAAAGAVLYPAYGLGALWLAAGAAAIGAVAALKL
ncbi:YoaK family protein [Novosphingobium sp.]|uniref:YoaK family protein n=1 Tax=Novosphingobium sp. TaxID=1874826 RepID=UPI003B52A67F